MLNENEVNNEMNSDVIADVNNDVNHEGSAMSEVNDVNGEVNNEVEVNNEEIEVSDEMNSSDVNNDVPEINHEEIEMSEINSDMGQQGQQGQQDGNKSDAVLDSESKGYEPVALVAPVATKKQRLFDKKLIPADEAELMNVPYQSIRNDFVPLYYDKDKDEKTRGHDNITRTETDTIMGMYTRDGGLPSKFKTDDIHCAPFAIVAYVESETKGYFGLLAKYQDSFHRARLLYLSLADIDENKYVRILHDNGFHLSDNTEFRAKFKKYLNSWKIDVDYIVPFVDRLGYSKAHHGFFMPDGLYLANSKKYAWFDNCNEQYLGKVTPKGTYEAWYENIAKEVVKYPLTAFATICSFGAPLLQLVDLTTMFFHFCGKSSRGKTMLLQLATSVHANGIDPNVDGSNTFIEKWNTTNAGLETIARLFDGCMGAFDELHMCDDKQFAASIYTICSGTSKQRFTRKESGKISTQEKHAWKFLALSSGEQSGFEKLSRNDTEDATLGRAIRFADIPVTGQIFTDFEGVALEPVEAEKLAFKLKEECGVNFGHAGRDFVQQLLQLADSKELLKAEIDKEIQVMFDKLTDGIDLQQEERRLMRHFAMIAVAGNYAVMFDILPMTEQRVFDTVCHVRDLWLSEMEHFHQQKAKKDDVAQVLAAWLSKNMTKFYPQYEPKAKANCKGYIKMNSKDEKDDIYLLTSESFNEVFGNRKASDVCADLAEKGILILPPLEKGTDGRFKQRHQISYRVPSALNNLPRLYTINASLLDVNDDSIEDDQSNSPDSSQQMLDMMMAKMEAMEARMASMS